MTNATIHHIKKIFGQSVLAAICVVVYDAILYAILSSFYKTQLNFILKPSVGPAEIVGLAVMFLLIGFGVAYFVILGIKRKRDALMRGAVFGLLLGCVYDLANYGLLVTWSAGLSSVNIVASTIGMAVVSAFVLGLTQRSERNKERAAAQPELLSADKEEVKKRK